MDNERFKRQNEKIKEKYDRISATVPAGTIDRIKASGETLNGFINRLIAADFERLDHGETAKTIITASPEPQEAPKPEPVQEIRIEAEKPQEEKKEMSDDEARDYFNALINASKARKNPHQVAQVEAVKPAHAPKEIEVKKADPQPEPEKIAQDANKKPWFDENGNFVYKRDEVPDQIGQPELWKEWHAAFDAYIKNAIRTAAEKNKDIIRPEGWEIIHKALED